MSLYIGNLDPDCSEAVLYKKFAPIGNLLSIRLHKEKKTGRCSGYGFINYASKSDAQIALSTLNYSLINDKAIRLMWADTIKNLPPNANIFIRNLHPNIDEKAIHDIFTNYGNILSLKLAVSEKGESRGFAFVQYQDEQSADLAIKNVDNKLLYGKVVEVSKFVPKDKRSTSFQNVYLKNFDPEVDDSQLFEMCKNFGDILSAKVMRDADGKSKCFGFVSFKSPHSAKAAVEALNGKIMNGRPLFAGRAMTKDERQKELLEKLKVL